MEENNLNNYQPMNNQNNKKSGNTGLVIIVVILALVIIGLTGFIVYDKFIKEDSKESKDNQQVVAPTPTPDNNKETEKELSLDSDLAKKLSKVVGAFKNDEISEYRDYFYKNSKVVLANETVKFKLALAGEKALDPSLIKDDVSNNVKYILEDDIKAAYNTIFGSNNDYSRTRFMIGCGDFSWSDKNNRYESPLAGGCGGISASVLYSKVDSAKEIGNKIEIYEKIYISDPENCYADYNKSVVLENCSGLSEDAVFNKYSDKASMYKYTFVKDSNGTYIFTSVEKVK